MREPKSVKNVKGAYARKHIEEFPLLDHLHTAGAAPLWNIWTPAPKQKKEMKEVLAKLKAEHELLLEHEPKNEFEACVLLGAINLIECQLRSRRG